MREATGTPAASRLEPMPSGSPARLLAGPQERGAAVADEHRVVDVDRVGVAGVVLGDDHLGACSLEQRAELLVLGGSRRAIRHAAPAVALDMTGVRGQRRSHEHALEVAPHRLGAVAGHEAEG